MGYRWYWSKSQHKQWARVRRRGFWGYGLQATAVFGGLMFLVIHFLPEAIQGVDNRALQSFHLVAAACAGACFAAVTWFSGELLYSRFQEVELLDEAEPSRKKRPVWSGVVLGILLMVVGSTLSLMLFLQEYSKVYSSWISLLSSGYVLLILGGLGVGLVWWSFNRRDVADLVTTARQQGLPSRERSLHRVFYCVALICFAVAAPMLLGGLIEQDSRVLPMLLFVVIGAAFAAVGHGKNKRYQKFGATLLKLNPLPGEIGGSVAGRFELNVQPVGDLRVRLRCTHSYSSGKGNSSTQERIVLFEADALSSGSELDDIEISFGHAVIKNGGVQFRFAVPLGLPESGSDDHKGVIRWELACKGQVRVKQAGGAEQWLFKRHWEIPVLKKSMAA